MSLPFTKEQLQKEIDDRFVSEQKHPVAELWIYNYTQKAQFDRHWNDVTRNCRGLILGPNMEVHARPFPKFFNLGEEENVQLPAEDFEVTEKLDGSLGILYWPKPDFPAIATRGSFMSDQAMIGTKMFQAIYLMAQRNKLPVNWDKSKTYLFEIIYPENRIVVDYGGQRSLVMLDVIDNETGKSCPLPDWYEPKVQKYDGIEDVKLITNPTEEYGPWRKPDNREGFCIKFANGQRFKVKFDEYVRLHRIVTGINSRHIWEKLRDGQNLEEILDRVPDEFFKWVKDTERDLKAKHDEIELMMKGAFDHRPKTDDRKELAEYFNKQEYPAILFKMLDGQPYDQIIWKIIKPKAETPFKEEV